MSVFPGSLVNRSWEAFQTALLFTEHIFKNSVHTLKTEF